MDQRHWEDLLFSANADGVLSDAELLGGLRMSRTITWSDRPGLFWDSQSAWEAMGISKSPFYRIRKALMDAGLLVEERGNLIPTSPESGIEIPDIGTGSPRSGTERPDIGTNTAYAFACSATREHPPTLPVTRSTTPAEIAAAYPEPEQFPLRAASTFALASLHQWPDAPEVSVQRMSRLIEEARQRYPDRVIWNGILGWLHTNRDSTSMRNPAAVFWRQCPEEFARIQHESSAKEAAQ